MADKLVAPTINIPEAAPMQNLAPALAALAGAGSAANIPFGLDPQQVGTMLQANSAQNDDLMKVVSLLADQQYKQGMLGEQRRQTEISKGQLDLSKFKIESELAMQQVELGLKEQMNAAQIKESGARTTANLAQAAQARAGAAAEGQRARLLSTEADMAKHKFEAIKSLQATDVTLPNGDSVNLGTIVSTGILPHLPNLVELDRYGSVTKEQLTQMQKITNDILTQDGDVDFGFGMKVNKNAAMMLVKEPSVFASLLQAKTADEGRTISPMQYVANLQQGLSKMDQTFPQNVQGFYEGALVGVRMGQQQATDKKTQALWDAAEDQIIDLLHQKFPALKSKIFKSPRTSVGEMDMEEVQVPGLQKTSSGKSAPEDRLADYFPEN